MAPFHRDHAGKANQGNAHLGGKKHASAIEHMWLSAENIGKVFSYIDDFDPELDSTLPIEAFKNYTRKCGGDVEKTLAALFVPPPPDPVECQSNSKCITRNVVSAVHATAWEGDTVVWTRLRCCWDDESGQPPCKCIRQNCPYRHASDRGAGGGQDLFELIPCVFAGMPDGCKWHRNKFRSTKWLVPPFELGEKMTGDEDEGPPPPPPPPSEAVEVAPVYDGQEWSLQRCVSKDEQEKAEYAAWFKAIMKDATKRFLDGQDSEGSNAAD